VVDNRALYIAAAKVNMMLAHMDIARKNLAKSGAELHIIGKDQQTSDLPEHAAEKGVKYVDHGVLTDIDERTRGVGGIYASCGEENLLGLPTDRYFGGSDIYVHEFAHTIMSYGFDASIEEKIKQQYKRSIAMGL
jgi:alpha-glucosidase